MARLHVFRDGQKISDVEINPGKEWIVGRSSGADIVLDGERGVSRQHLKIFSENGQWNVEVLSRYGELYQNGRKISSLKLEDGVTFEVPPFAFAFESSDEEAVASNDAHYESAPAPSESADQGFGDRTMVGVVRILPYLKVSNPQGEVVQIFQLDGHAWVTGRDTNCAIFIDNPVFSRRHFEIRFEEGAYLIKDLESSNGTMVNNEAISSLTWTVLRSGDVITVVDWNLQFELRDSSFEEKLKEIPQELQLQNHYPAPVQSSMAQAPAAISYPPGDDYYQMPPTVAQSPLKKLTPVRILMGVLLVGGVIGYFLQGNESSAPAVKPAKSNSAPFEKLTAQQQQYVKDTYRLADRLFKEGRYEMARQEVAKIHQLVPFYEDSINLGKLADIAIQTQVEQQKAEVREKEQEEMEQKIEAQLAQCRKLVGPHVEMKQIDDCLNPVIVLNPDHAGILQLKAQVDEIISARTVREEKQAEYMALVHKQKRLYDKAEDFLKVGKPLDAIQAFGVVVSSKLPDPHNLKGQARRQIASIQTELTNKQAELEREADQFHKDGNLKKSIQTLQKALAINPENETLKGKVNSMLSELRKQVQSLYQEGVLEESVGEVDTAKTKWKKITELSLPEEEYYKKARSKLKKYGE